MSDTMLSKLFAKSDSNSWCLSRSSTKLAHDIRNSSTSSDCWCRWIDSSDSFSSNILNLFLEIIINAQHFEINRFGNFVCLCVQKETKPNGPFKQQTDERNEKEKERKKKEISYKHRVTERHTYFDGQKWKCVWVRSYILVNLSTFIPFCISDDLITIIFKFGQIRSDVQSKINIIGKLIANRIPL